MRHEWLEDILAAIDCGSFTAAARRRNVSVPAFSRRMRQIETALGAQLFDRSTSPVRPTHSAIRLQDRMRMLDRELRGLATDLRAASSAAPDHLEIACQPVIARLGILEGLTANTSAQPKLLTHVAPIEECYGRLLRGQAQVVLALFSDDATGMGAQPDVEMQLLRRDRLIAVARPQPPFAQGLAQLIATPREVAANPAGIHGGQKPSAAPRLALRVETALCADALNLARKGVGIAWVPELLVTNELREGRLKRQIDLRSTDLSLVALRLNAPHSADADGLWRFLVNTLKT